MRREGTCPPEQCQGACCVFLGVFLSAPSEQLDFLVTRGIPVVATTNEEVQYAMVPQRCQHLTPEGRCGIYASRPEVCRTFPTGPEDLLGLPNCGYQFVEENADATAAR